MLRVSLWRTDGALLGRRELSRTSSCAELAAAAAVVVAAWESDVHPEFRPPLVSIVPPNEVTTPPPAAVVHTPSAPTPTRVVFEVGAAVSGSAAPAAGHTAAGAGALIVASVTPSQGSVGLRLMLAGTTERAISLGAGRVLWRRLVIGLGPSLRLPQESTPFAVDLHAEVLAAWLPARGEGFTALGRRC